MPTISPIPPASWRASASTTSGLKHRPEGRGAVSGPQHPRSANPQAPAGRGSACAGGALTGPRPLVRNHPGEKGRQIVNLVASATVRPARWRTSEEVERLVGAAAAGDQRAWNALLDEFSGLLWAVARAHRLSDADAADVVQSTWLRLFEHLEGLHDPARVGGWLATTARRECLRLLRKSERMVLFGDVAPERESSEIPPVDALLERERDAALWRGFTRLWTSDQALLRLLMADPRPPYEDIAAALDMPIGSIGPTRQRALERLRQKLDSQGSLSLMTA